MTNTIQTLSNFAHETSFEKLPPEVVEESKRLIIDSIGCALAGTEHPRGQIARKYAELHGRGADNFSASIIGVPGKFNVTTTAFVNAELVNALDFDAILPPGHVSPYVIPGILAFAEVSKSGGQELITALALAHEISNRIGKAQDNLRDIIDGKNSPPVVNGYSSTIFGGTAAIGKIRKFSAEQIAHALGIAGSTAPVNSQWSFSVHSHFSTLKYHLAGALAATNTNAALLAELGHTGDLEILDDKEHGWCKMINTRKWDIEKITQQLGTRWNFPAEQSYKPYPHCRILHAPLDALMEIINENHIQVDEIESIKAWVEGFVMKPLWLNRDITDIAQGQFSVAHGLSVGAHNVEPGKKWQTHDVVFDPSVIRLMDKISFEVHPDYERLLISDPASRPTRIEVKARGQVFSREKRFPKGSPSVDPSSKMTNEEISDKFIRNAEGVIRSEQTQAFLDRAWQLEKETSVAELLKAIAL